MNFTTKTTVTEWISALKAEKMHSKVKKTAEIPCQFKKKQYLCIRNQGIAYDFDSLNSWLEQLFAAIAQLVEHVLAKVGVASSSLVCRSNRKSEMTISSHRACPGGGMVDALVSGASVERRAGSSPVLGTVSYGVGHELNLERWRNW